MLANKRELGRVRCAERSPTIVLAMSIVLDVEQARPC
jgi:hypothetical protein